MNKYEKDEKITIGVIIVVLVLIVVVFVCLAAGVQYAR